MGNDTSTPETDEPFCLLIADLMKDKDAWRGTATELSETLNSINLDCGINHLNITKKLNGSTGLFKEKYNIEISTDERKTGKRTITLTRTMTV
jgi:hypothetical protein